MSLLKFMPVQNKKVFARENRKTNEQIKKYMHVEVFSYLVAETKD
jgi:hypothetical protein